MIESGIVSTPGVYPPEALAADERVLDTLPRELTDRGVTYREVLEPA
ncbi:MAG: hypothetical protein QGI75_00970 [Phycisphaerales bacterium]|jgi:hypothetical protein|nr:hypothetical protein [Phycisphaerales bacterium]MDP6889903.1 hypothetical protein [Phycisphaerales bacterium]